MENEGKSGLMHVLEAIAYILPIMLAITIAGWMQIPDGQRIIIHWNIKGQPDGYSSKAFALLGLPVFIIIMAGLLMILAKAEKLASVNTIMVRVQSSQESEKKVVCSLFVCRYLYICCRSIMYGRIDT